MINQSFKVEESPRIKVNLKSGTLDIRPGNVDEIVVEVDTNDSYFTVDQRSGTVIIGQGGGRRMKWAAITVKVPPGCSADITTVSATITIRADLARLDVATASGDVRFKNVERLQAKTASGRIKGDSVSGEAQIMTASGDVRISKLEDRATLSTASGDIKIDNAGGRLNSTSVSGDVRVLTYQGSELQGKTMSGNVVLGIPRGTRLDLDAHSYSGRIRMPPPDPNPSPNEREMSIRVNQVSGDLRIKRV